MKSIHPVAYQLSVAEDRIKALEKENHELRLEVARLGGQETWQSNTSQPTPPKRRRLSTSEDMLPSYARSTSASRLRSSQSSSPTPTNSSQSTDWSSSPSTPSQCVSVNGKNCTYKDGTLSVMGFGYLKDTVASRRREWASEAVRMRLGNFRTDTDSCGWGYPTDRSRDADYSEETEDYEEPQPANLRGIMSQTDWDDIVTQKAIATRTRLAEITWIIRSDYTVYIDHDALFDILSRTEVLAKRCLWGWMRAHRPEQCRRWIGYWSDIDFGREALTRLVDVLSRSTFNFRHTRYWEVTSKLDRLIDMRNCLHHFNGGHSVRYIDLYVENVQQLAVLLYDEESASRARALRDMLHEEAERTLREIESFMLLTSLPEAGDTWKPHHASLINGAAFEINRGFLSHSYPPIVYTAAREWTSRHQSRSFGIALPDPEPSAQSEISRYV